MKCFYIYLKLRYKKKFWECGWYEYYVYIWNKYFLCKKKINLMVLNINKGSDCKKSFNKNLNICGEKIINSILIFSVCVKYDVI